MAWTTPPTAVTGAVAQAADFNILRDDLNYLYGSTGAIVLSTSASYIDFADTTGHKLDLYADNYGLGINNSELAVFANANATIGWRIGTSGPEAPQYASLSTSVFKHILNRQGGSSSDWRTPGVNNYVETGAFIMAGVIQATCPSTDSLQVLLTLPIQPTTNCWIPMVSIHSTGGLFEPIRRVTLQPYLSGTALIIDAWFGTSGSSWPANTLNINWMVIGKG